MAEILLHIGMPKTATTTLQDLFFSDLHQQGKINYLGKRTKANLKTTCKQEKKYYLIYQKVLYPLRWGINFLDNLVEHKKLLNSIIDNHKINVISDENFFFCFQSEYHHNQAFDEKLAKRYQLLFAGHKIKVLCIFRKQADFLYSWYTFHYELHWFYIKNNDTIAKHYKHLILQFTKSTQMLYYADLMERFQQLFSTKASCIFFEELLTDKASYYQKIANLLRVEITKKNIPNSYLNQRLKTVQGVCSRPIIVPGKVVEIGQVTANYKFLLYRILVLIFRYGNRIFIFYNIFLSIKKKENIRQRLIQLPLAIINFLYFPKIHPFFTKEQKQTIANLCKENNKKLAFKKFCTLQDLKKYNYF